MIENGRVRKAVWRKITVDGKPIVARYASKSQGVTLRIEKVGNRFVARGPFTIESQPGMDFDEFFRLVGWRLYEYFVG